MTADRDLWSALKVWAGIAAASFGGPAGQIAVMHQQVVERLNWVSEKRFMAALNLCLLLPGPEAQQLAIYLGWMSHGIRGAVLSGLVFILPGVLSILILSILYVTWGDVPLVMAAFTGIKAAVLIIVVQAVHRLSGKAAQGMGLKLLALVSLCAAFLGVSFPLIVLCAGVAGWWLGRSAGAATGASDAAQEDQTGQAALQGGWTAAGISAVLWVLPLCVLALVAGSDHLMTSIAAYFAGLSVLSFGGAYAALSWMAQHAVEAREWLTAGQMLDGLGLAESTPGPLITVTQYTGFMAAWNAGHGLGGAILASLLTSWMIFAPGFVFIFALAPQVDRLLASRAMSAALAGISAAVLGVMLNLALWFGLQTLFAEHHHLPLGWVSLDYPALSSLQLAPLLLVIAMGVAGFGLRVGLFRLLGLGAVGGICLSFLPV
ncbi:MAG: chromate efflux transporter [Alphaproteobacteria bacterium]